MLSAAERLKDIITVGQDRSSELAPAGKMAWPRETRCEFRDYAPAQFAKIRAAVGVSPEEYEEAFGQAQDNENSEMHERFSEGKSGSFFYFTPNKKYLVKTVSAHEVEACIQMATQLAEHVQEHPGTLLHYYGAHALQPQMSQEVLYIVVLKNLFDVSFVPASLGVAASVEMQDCWDLKGALFLREALDDSQRAACVAGGTKPKGSYLDLDWLAMERCMEASEEAKAQMLKQVQQDVAFLAEQSCLDYSLLLACATIIPDEEGLEMAQLTLPARPGMLQLGEKLYMFGIVDITELWSCKWKVQKGLLQSALKVARCCNSVPQRHPSSITAVTPPEYAERFADFVKTSVLQMSRSVEDQGLEASESITSSVPEAPQSELVSVKPAVVQDADNPLFHASQLVPEPEALHAVSADRAVHLEV